MLVGSQQRFLNREETDVISIFKGYFWKPYTECMSGTQNWKEMFKFTDQVGDVDGEARSRLL